MSVITTIQANHTLVLKSGKSELAITNAGQGDTNYTITIGKNPTQQQKLSGPGSMQAYEEVTYPIEIDNLGPDSVQLTE